MLLVVAAPPAAFAQDSTTTTLATSNANTLVGDNVTVTVTVTSGGGTPDGNVTLFAGATPIGTQTLVGGVTAFTTTAPAGTYAVTAQYLGSASFLGSTSDVLRQRFLNATATSISLSGATSNVGEVVTMAAAVTSASTPSGTVVFRDGTKVLGSVGLVAGVGTFRTTALAPGARSITASYLGNGSFAASTSAAEAHTVGNGATLATIESNLNPSTFGETVTFTGAVFTLAAGVPSGNLDFNDLTFPVTIPVALGAGTTISVPGGPFNFAASSFPYAITAVDLNNDGYLDLIAANRDQNQVGGFAGAAGGAFTGPATVSVGTSPVAVAAGDFNGDGNPDLVTANTGSNDVSVLLGDGLFGFATAVSYATGNGPLDVAVRDVNDDGIEDLVVANQTDNSVSILLGNGDGTFAAKTDYPAGNSVTSVAAADFNGDGSADLAVTAGGDAAVAVLLNNGFGAFGTPTSFAAGTAPRDIVAADFNGDNFLDLGVANQSSNDVTVHLGVGDGTFATAVPYAAQSGTSSIAVGDVTTDGFLDILAANPLEGSGSVSAFIGAGDGTFSGAVNTAAGVGAIGVTVADLSGGGRPDVALASSFGDRIDLLFSVGAASASLPTNALVAGSHDLTTSFTAQGLFDASTSTTLPQVVNKANTTTSVTTDGPAVYGSSVLKATVVSATTGTPTGTVNFTADGSPVGSATLDGSGIALLSLPTAVPHTYNVVAEYVGDTNFNTSSSASTPLSVSPAPLTVTAENKSRTYGAANPAFTVTFTGFVNGEDQTALGGTLACSSTADANSTVAGSPYAITCSGFTSANYNISYVDGTLAVEAAPLTITADNASRAYAAADPTFTAQMSGFVNGEDQTALTGTLACSSTATVNSGVAGSPYPISCSGLTSTNYNISYVDGQLTVTAVPLTITADNASRAYGSANPAFTAQFAGFVNGEDATALTGTLACSSSATASSGVAGSPYAITCSGLTSTNYNISYVDGQLTVTAVPLTITADNASRAYGAANPAFTAGFAGFVNGEDATALTGTLACSSTATASSGVAGSPYPITCSGLTSTNYNISFVDGQLTVTAVPLTITANNASRAYGAANPTFTAGFAGFVNGEDATALTGTLACSSTATASSGVAGSPYAITCSGLTSTNYNISYVDGQLTITAVPLTVTANNASRAYGAANPAFTAGFAGFVNGEDATALTGTLACSSTATASSGVAGSPYAITCSGLTSTNYNISYVDGQLTVTAVPLTITANNASRAYGAANPAFTAGFAGFVNGEDATALTGTLACSSTATASSGVAGSPYPIACSGVSSTNYTISFVNGQLTITAVPLTVTANNASRAYGAANPTFTAGFAGFVNGEDATALTGTLACSTTATASSSVAGSPYAITCSGLTSTNYTISFVNGQLTITAVPLTITANNASRAYGAANPTFTAGFAGFVNGEDATALTGTLACSSTATASSGVAGSPYAITCSGLTSTNYTISFVNGQLTITAVPLTITANNASRVYGAANPTFTAALAGFVNGEDATALTGTLACSTTAVANSSVAGSPYPISCSGVSSTNYTISFVNGQLTITAAPLTITAADASRTYGAVNPAFTGTITGALAGDDVTAAYSSVAVANSNVGTYAIVPAAGGAALPNYNVTLVNGTLTVTPAALSVTANNKSRVFGTANPAFDGTLTGVVAGDNITATYATSATTSSNVGTYSITPTLVDPDTRLGNYTVTSTNGTLTITQATSTTTLAANPTSAVTGASVTFTATVASANGNPTGSVTFMEGTTTLGSGTITGGQATFATTALALGAHNITAVYAGDTNFTGSTSTAVTVTISAPLVVPTITSISPVSFARGASGGTLTITGTAFLAAGTTVNWNGSARATTFVSSTSVTAAITAADLANSGTATVTVTTAGGTSNAKTVSIDLPATGVTVTLPATVTVAAGATAQVNVTLGGFSSAASVTCLNAPTGVTCLFNQLAGVLSIQTSATTPKGTHVITVVFTTGGVASAAPAGARKPFGWEAAGIAPVFGLLLLGGKGRRKKARLLLGLILLGMLMLIAGCGGSPDVQAPTVTPARVSAPITVTVT